MKRDFLTKLKLSRKS